MRATRLGHVETYETGSANVSIENSALVRFHVQSARNSDLQSFRFLAANGNLFVTFIDVIFCVCVCVCDAIVSL